MSTIADEINRLIEAVGGKQVHTGSIADALSEYTRLKAGVGTGGSIADVLHMYNQSSAGPDDGSEIRVFPGVQFVDYDGTVKHFYTPSEIGELTELPDGPEHDRLVGQGWNWSLEDIKDYMETYPEALLTVGQIYTTKSGACEFDIVMTEEMLKYFVTLAIKVNGEVEIDWGDGSENYTYTGTDSEYATVVFARHQYEDAGSYTIKLFVRDGGAKFVGITLGPEYIPFVEALTNPDYTKGSTTMLRGAFLCEDIIETDFPKFYNHQGLEYLTLCDGITEIPASYFSDCYSLKSLSIPDGVETIGQASFSKCNALSSLSIPNSVETIDSSAFADCYALKSLAIPESTTTINMAAFNNCYSLASLTFYETQSRTIGSQAFSKCNSLVSLTIPSGVTTIGSTMFSYCRDLTSLVIPASVTSIGYGAFRNCEALTSLSIPDTVATIGGSSFSNCYSLTSLTLGSGVTSVGDGAFAACVSLTAIHLNGTTPPTITAGSFGGLPEDAVIYVPAASVDTYKAATNWSAYASQIEAEPA